MAELDKFDEIAHKIGTGRLKQWGDWLGGRIRAESGDLDASRRALVKMFEFYRTS